MVQAVWSTAHGHPLRVTNLARRAGARGSARTSTRCSCCFAPLWWLWPSPDLLLVAQAIALALGALPVYWLARKHLGSSRAGLGFALAYLVYPATTWLALNEFHPGALATPALLFAFWYLDEDRLVPFAVVRAARARSAARTSPLVVAGFGVWYALARGRRREGAAIAAAGVVVDASSRSTLVIPHFRGGQTPFVGRYSEARRRLALHHPCDAASASRSTTSACATCSTLVLPLAGLCLLAPIALAALPRARAEPALGDADADVDPLPLHGRDHPAARRRGRARRRARPRARRRLPVASIALADGADRQLPPRRDPALERAARTARRCSRARRS